MSEAPLCFLHTAAVHVAGFERLVQSRAPGLRVRHLVDETLLAEAQARGADDAGVIERVQRAMREAASGGARVVVCTCSTIGGAAERTRTDGSFHALRIDRAMADRAVALGPRVLVVAALASTLAPTCALIGESAAALKRPVALQTLLVEGAWAHFQRGAPPAYIQAIVDAVGPAAGDADVVVLAQASMAPAAEALARPGREVLASPALGVAQALARLRELQGQQGPAVPLAATLPPR